jgi:SAM-dependent methyltransferase
MNTNKFLTDNEFSTLVESSILQSKDEYKYYTNLVNELQLVGHHDPQKNWDSLKAFLNIITRVSKNSPLLDAGSSGDSAILRWLAQFGYENLYACDVRDKSKKYQTGRVKFSLQDLANTNYPAGSFSAVTCISVIEHGVNFYNFFSEMKRIIRPGGLLLISTDYWSQSIDTTGIFPYGLEFGQMKVLQNDDLVNILTIASHLGFSINNRFGLRTGEKAVRWERVDREYTFVFMCFTLLG